MHDQYFRHCLAGGFSKTDSLETKLFKKISLGLTILSLSACVTSSGQSDIVPIGKDTYMVGRAGGFFTVSGAEVKAQLYRDANAFCQTRGKNLMPVSTSSNNSAPYTYATAELQFRCLADGDPGLKRPTMESRPDVTIQMQR